MLANMTHAWESKWAVGDVLGQGNQGIVYEVASVDDPSATGALKQLHRRYSQHRHARQRMRDETDNLKAVSEVGAAVPAVLDDNIDYFEDPTVDLYLVMELISGVTLREYVRVNGRLDFVASARFVISLCETVELIHALGIVHRGLHPNNILVRDADAADLVPVDYGASLNVYAEATASVAEEFLHDLRETCEILWFCLTGCDVLGLHPMAWLKGRSRHDERHVALLEDFLIRGFHPNAANRFQTIGEVRTALDDIARESQGVGVIC